jgi:hypothetical protein
MIEETVSRVENCIPLFDPSESRYVHFTGLKTDDKKAAQKFMNRVYGGCQTVANILIDNLLEGKRRELFLIQFNEKDQEEAKRLGFTWTKVEKKNA